MMPRTVMLARPASSVIHTKPRAVCVALLDTIQKLAAMPHPERHALRFQDLPGLLAARCGEWRIAFALDEVNAVLFVLAVLRRARSRTEAR